MSDPKQPPDTGSDPEDDEHGGALAKEFQEIESDPVVTKEVPPQSEAGTARRLEIPEGALRPPAATPEKRGQPDICDGRCRAMRDEAQYYHQRAAHCRELAESARDEPTFKRLLELAADFEKEAERLEGDQAT